MDIPALATGLAQSSLSNNVSVAVARKSLDSQKQQGEAAVQLLEGAVKLAEQCSGDASGPSPSGRLDVTA